MYFVDNQVNNTNFFKVTKILILGRNKTRKNDILSELFKIFWLFYHNIDNHAILQVDPHSILVT